jgi:hypothetical protein
LAQLGPRPGLGADGDADFERVRGRLLIGNTSDEHPLAESVLFGFIVVELKTLVAHQALENVERKLAICQLTGFAESMIAVNGTSIS